MMRMLSNRGVFKPSSPYSEAVESAASLSRRQVVTLFGGAAAMYLLEGCGGGSGTGNVPSGPVVGTAGTVNIPGISADAMKVLSAYADSMANVANSQFKVDVSSRAAHVVLAMDANNAARGMSVSVPNSSVNHAFQIDSNSTAAALIFLAPGIVASNPADAQNRLQTILALPQYAALRDALAGALTSAPLSTAIATPAVQAAYTDCLNGYLSTTRSARRRSRLITTDNSSNNDPTLNFALGDTSNPAQVPLTIKNADLRVLQVYRKDFPSSGSVPTIQQLNDMSGAEGASVGGLISGRIGDPTEMDLTLDMSASGSYRVEFYFRGMGKATPDLVISPDMHTAFTGTDSLNSATIKTILWNFIVPLLSFVLGFTYELPEGSDAKIWTDAISVLLSDAGVLDASNNLANQMAQGANDIELAHSCVTFAEAVLGVLVADGTIENILTIEFTKLGLGGVVLFGRVGLAKAAITVTGAIYAGLGGGQLIFFMMELVDWHGLNRSVVTATGTGTVGIS